jgi:ligand-binding SRPBCC domain-containing protein
LRIHLFERRQRLPVEPAEAFEFFAEAGNLERITPPWLHFRLLEPRPVELGQGTLLHYRLRLRGIPIRWVTRIEEWHPGEGFTDLQLRGPYRHWHHTHSFEPDPEGTVMTDTVRYAMRAGPLGELARRGLVTRDLARIFDFRRDAIAGFFAR